MLRLNQSMSSTNSKKKIVVLNESPLAQQNKNQQNSSSPERKEKLFYRWEEVCRLTQIAPEILETWENELPFLHSGRTRTGKKIFRQKDVEIIRRLKELIDKEGMTLAGAKRQVEEEFKLTSPTPINLEKLKKAMTKIRHQLVELQQILHSKK